MKEIRKILVASDKFKGSLSAPEAWPGVGRMP
jgi:glycerate kinase